MKELIKIIGWLTFFCGTGMTFAQSPDKNYFTAYVKDFHVRDGISQSNVNAILKDSEGFIWIGTDDGLNKFNGYNFKVFKNDPDDSSSVSNNKILSIFEDSRHRLWVGTISGLNLFNKKTETFTRFYHDPDNDNTISHNSVLCFAEDSDKNLWFGTYWGLNKLNYDKNRIDRFYYSPDRWGIKDNAVNAILVYQDSLRWIGTNKGVTLMNKDGVILDHPDYTDVLPEFFNNLYITAIAKDNESKIWFGTNTQGAFRYDPQTGEVSQFRHSRNDLHSLSSDYVSDIMVDKNGRVWISTNENGVSIYDPRQNCFIRINPKNDPAFLSTAINTLYQDNEKFVWVGTYGQGLKLLNVADKKFDHLNYFDAFMQQSGKTSILSLAQDHNNNIWIGTDGAGLYKYDPANGTFEAYRHDPDNKNSISGNIIKSLFVDKKGNLYAGTYAHGLNYIDLRNNKVTRYEHDPDDMNTISGPHVWDIYEDRSSRIWVGTLGDGLNEFIPETGTFVHYSLSQKKGSAAISDFITKMYEDSYGKLWIGTIGGSICRMNRKDKSFTHYLQDDGKYSSGLIEVVDIYESKDSILWIGSKGGGLFRYNRAADKFVPAKVNGKMPSTIQAILEDDKGHLWLSSYDGVSKYDPEKNVLINYDVYDGLQGQEFNSRSKLKSATGEYYFGGLNGINVFRPENVRETNYFPPLALTNFYLFHKEVNPSPQSDLLKSHINYQKEITLRSYQNVFSIQFAALDYAFPKKISYAYFLEGFDKTYNYVDDHRMATYTNIPPGTYKFKVIAANNNGRWNKDGASLTIRVLRPWYKLVWVQALLVAGGIGLVTGFIRIRTQYLSRQKKKLETLVKERTRQIEKQKDEIEKKNLELEMQNSQIKASNDRIKIQNAELTSKNSEIMAQRMQINEKSEQLEKAHNEVQIANEELIRVNNNLENLVEKRTDELKQALEKLIKTDEGLNTFLYRSSHDLRGPITTLLGLVQLVEKENKQKDIREYIEKIRFSCTQMLRFLKKLNDTNLVFRTKKKVEKINWNKILSEIAIDLDDVNTGDGVEIVVDNNVNVALYSDELLIKTIIHNLMENAIVFKKGSKPYVKLGLGHGPAQLTITVTDNGIGIDRSVEDKIFDMFYRGSEYSSGNGLGLFLVKRAVEMLEGRILVRSKRDYTQFTIVLPVEYSSKRSPVNHPFFETTLGR